MLQSPFTFYRGAASIMACDMQSTPNSGIQTRICGDAHLLNFGAFGTPERRFIFDVNDFDETTVGAWEWDLKRLTTSFEIAGRFLKLRGADARDAVLACARSYRERMLEFADEHVLDVWYARVDEDVIGNLVSAAEQRSIAAQQSDVHLWPSVATRPDGSLVVADKPPKVFHPPDSDAYEEIVRDLLQEYERSIQPERRAIFERFTFADAAYKVVGVGSVGTRCSVALFVAAPGDMLWLQVKEARASVYERYAPSGFTNHGERVVIGQRLLQASSDLFLGWANAEDGHAFYVRQLRDMKTSPNIDEMTGGDLKRYASACGWALARAHAKASGKAAAIAGYLGRGDTFDRSLAAFADAYADQNESDYRALVKARDDGRIVADPNGTFPKPQRGDKAKNGAGSKIFES
jgi:uncharacterized protein (DUF2252 family)